MLLTLGVDVIKLFSLSLVAKQDKLNHSFLAIKKACLIFAYKANVKPTGLKI
jgi:hypothetical protein